MAWVTFLLQKLVTLEYNFQLRGLVAWVKDNPELRCGPILRHQSSFCLVRIRTRNYVADHLRRSRNIRSFISPTTQSIAARRK